MACTGRNPKWGLTPALSRAMVGPGFQQKAHGCRMSNVGGHPQRRSVAVISLVDVLTSHGTRAARVLSSCFGFAYAIPQSKVLMISIAEARLGTKLQKDARGFHMGSATCPPEGCRLFSPQIPTKRQNYILEDVPDEETSESENHVVEFVFSTGVDTIPETKFKQSST